MTEPEPAQPSFVPYVAGPPPEEPLRPAAPVAVPAPVGRARLRPFLFGAIGVLAGSALGVGVAFAAGGGRHPAPQAAAAAAAEPTTVYVTRTIVVTVPATTSPAAAVTTSAAPPPPPPPPSITDGTWTVGEDLPAGTYKATGASANCYWAILKSGTNGADIVDNHLGGGNLRVTLKAGQDFETNRCGTWVKTG